MNVVLKSALGGVVTGLLLILTGTATASATSGSWGAERYPFTAGVICASGADSIPLVSWPSGSTDASFLTTGIRETAGIDTGHPPAVGDPAATQAAVPASSRSAALAYLIDHWGSDPNDARVAEVAEIVAEVDGQPTGAGCLAAGTGATSTSDANALWLQAQQLAGPYRIELGPSVAAVSLGQPTPVSASITSALGYRVPGLTVTFTAGAATSTAVTDADGSAAATLTVDGVSASQAVQIVASVVSPITVTERTAPGATPVILLSTPALTVSASSEVPVDSHASPVVTTAVSATLALAGAPISTSLSVTGLNGHAAGALMTVLGPLPPDPSGSCAPLTSARWSQALAADTAKTLTVATATLQLIGDAHSAGPSFTARSTGCYTTGAQLTTTDASPAATATASWGSAAGSATVLPLGVSAALAPGGVGSADGPITATVSLTQSSGAHGTAGGFVRGPVDAVAGSCAGISWSSVPIAARFGPQAVQGDGRVTLTADTVAQVGCYALDATVSLTVGELGSVSVHTVAGSTGSVALLIHPTISARTRATGVTSGQAIHADVTVLGTYTQRATVSGQLRWVPSIPQGCDNADWSRAVTVSSAAPVTASGSGTYLLTAGPVTKVGCYSLVPELSLPADSAVQASGTTGEPGSVFLVAPVIGVFHRIPPGTEHDGLRIWSSGIAFGLLLCAAVVRTVLLARATSASPTD